MSKIMSKFGMVVLIVVIAIVMLPYKIFAAEGDANTEVIKETDGKYIVYVEGIDDFSYAISDKSDADEMELDYILAVDDSAGTKVATINETGTIYFWAKNGENAVVTAKEIKLDDETFTTDNLSDVGKVTQKIPATVEENVSTKQSVDDEGVTVTVSLSGLKLNVDDSGYTYQIFPAEGDYEKLMTLAENLPEKLNTYDGIEKSKEFYSLYTTLKSNLNSESWLSAENNIIEQPEDATDGTKYVIFIKNSDGSIEDVQFLTSTVGKEEKFEKEKKIVQETSRLPITGENIALIIAFAVVVALLVIVFIKMKKSIKEDK